MGDQRPSRSTITRQRVEHLEALDRLLTDILAALMQQGVLSLEMVAIDGRWLATSPRELIRHALLTAITHDVLAHAAALIA